MSAHRSQLLRDRLVRDSELIVVMAADQARAMRRYRHSNILVLGDLDPEGIDDRTIKDPWGGTDEDFDDSYERIDRCVRRLVAAITDDKS
jgi:protein-tyrosine-phosphatase